MAAGRSRAPATGRCWSGSWPRCPLAVGSERSWLQLRQPAHRAQARHEAVLATAGDDERRQVVQPATDRPLRHGEASGAVVRADQRVLLQWGADEDAVVEPLGLDELELAPEVRAGEHEDDAAIGAIVLEHTLGQYGPVAG